MPKYLDPKSDIVFKKIFGDHPHLLISFLNAVLPLAPDNLIVEIIYLPTEQIPDIPAFKCTIADVKCKDAQGRAFIVEMQMNWTDSFKQRLLFGTSQAVVKQLEKGQDYHLLQPVYGLGLVAEIYEEATPAWYHHYQLVKKGSADGDVIHHLQLIFIELPKFPVHSSDEKKLRLLWLRFLREIDEKTTAVSQELLDIPEIAQAIELTEEAAYTPAELSVYQSYWDQVSREKTLLHGKYIKGRAEGRAEGLLEGEARGEARGKAEERRDLVCSMHQKGLSIQDIAQYTNLTIEAVTDLLR